jgi:tetratricopeptide (TPR) repeat protein
MAGEPPAPGVTPTGTLAVALAHAQRLLQREPQLAAEQAGEILKVMPGQPHALQLLALALGAQGRFAEAAATLRHAVTREPRLADAWRILGDQLTLAGEHTEAAVAYARHVQASIHDPLLLAPAAALAENRLPEAETLLRSLLQERPTDVVAIRMFAEVAARLGRYVDAALLLERCLELAPGFTAARHHYAMVLYRQSKSAEPLQVVQQLLAEDPRHPGYRSMHAALLARVGDYQAAIGIYGELLAEHPAQPQVWMSYGHALKTAGRQPESIEAYRRTTALRPGLGEAWWSLANLKTFRFTPADIAAMRAQLVMTGLDDEDRLHLHFSLGKAFEDEHDYARSFEHYAAGNRIRRGQIQYHAAENRHYGQLCRERFTPGFFAARAGSGHPAPDPIFIVGLPRSGSTLVEQILSSHPQVEGTMELPDIIAIARGLGHRHRDGSGAHYLDALSRLNAAGLRALGERYLEGTRIQRRAGKPLYIDKMPNNFAHTGLIHLILPNARIIDVRRHPMGCCFSGFKQHFARGQTFTYDLCDIGSYYRDYVALMAHFDAVLPGRVHRVTYEQLVNDTEAQVRLLLDYCGLPFDERCLRFFENDRAVRTASSEQVRKPIFRDAVEHWRHYEPWLSPLQDALGPVLASYPDPPIDSD